MEINTEGENDLSDIVAEKSKEIKSLKSLVMV